MHAPSTDDRRRRFVAHMAGSPTWLSVKGRMSEFDVDDMMEAEVVKAPAEPTPMDEEAAGAADGADAQVGCPRRRRRSPPPPPNPVFGLTLHFWYGRSCLLGERISRSQMSYASLPRLSSPPRPV